MPTFELPELELWRKKNAEKGLHYHQMQMDWIRSLSLTFLALESKTLKVGKNDSVGKKAAKATPKFSACGLN